jgi:hypothetical protein
VRRVLAFVALLSVCAATAMIVLTTSTPPAEPFDTNQNREVSYSVVKRLPLGATRARVERRIGAGGRPSSEQRFDEVTGAQCWYYTRAAAYGKVQLCYRRGRLVEWWSEATVDADYPAGTVPRSPWRPCERD